VVQPAAAGTALAGLNANGTWATVPVGGQSWQRNVCSYSGSTHGDQVRACISDAIAAGGGICDSRCIEGTTNNTTGVVPIEIGTPTVRVIWQLPSTGSLTVTQNGASLPTPSAPGLSVSTTSGTLPAGTYYVKIAYKSGGGHSAASVEASATLGAAGTLTITSPGSTSYSYSYDVYAATTSGTETWQANCLIGYTCAIGVTYPGTLLSGYETAPTSANGVPAIIVHSGKGSGIISDASGSGYRLQPNSTMNVSNEIATEDTGSVVLKNLYLGDYSELGTVTDSLILLQDQFSGSSVSGIWGVCLPGGPFLKIRQSNDVVWDNLVLSAGDQSTCNPVMSIDSRHQFSDRSDNSGDITLTNLNIISPATNATMLDINGNAYGTASGGASRNIVLINPSFENPYISSNLKMVNVNDMVGLDIINPVFQYLTGSSGNVALTIAEDNPCMTQGIRVENASLTSSSNVTFADDTITPNIVTGNAAYPASPNVSYQFGISPADSSCATTAVNYTTGVQDVRDGSSYVQGALVSNGPAGVVGTQLVANNIFTGTVGSGNVATGWTLYAESGATATSTLSASPTIDPQGLSQVQQFGQTTAVGNTILASNTFSLTAGEQVTYYFSIQWVSGATTIGVKIANSVATTTYCPVHQIPISATTLTTFYTCNSAATGTDARLQFVIGYPTVAAEVVNLGYAGVQTQLSLSRPGFGVGAQASSAVSSVTFTGDGTVLSATPSTAVTTSGTLTAALANAPQNSVLAGPATGGAGAPSYQTAPTISAANMTNIPAASPAAKIDLTSQAASISPTLLLSSATGGSYIYWCDITITQAATTSSTMPGCQIQWTDADSSVSHSYATTSTQTGNTVGITSSGQSAPSNAYIQIKNGTNVYYGTTGYVSSGATPMQYALHVKLTYLGN